MTEAAIHIGVALAGEPEYAVDVKRLEALVDKDPMNAKALRNLTTKRLIDVHQ